MSPRFVDPLNRRRDDLSAIASGGRIESPVSAVTQDYVRRKRRGPRSDTLLEAVRQLDVAGDPRSREELRSWLEQEYSSRGGGAVVGILAKCYLGHPYVDHRLDMVGGIVEHYRPADALPGNLDAARTLAQSPHYAFVEVYADGSVIPIRPDGSPAA